MIGKRVTNSNPIKWMDVVNSEMITLNPSASINMIHYHVLGQNWMFVCVCF